MPWSLEIAKSHGLTLVEQNLGYYDMYSADEVFVTGTAAEVAPIVCPDRWPCDRHPENPAPSPASLMAAFKTVTETEGTPIYQ